MTKLLFLAICSTLIFTSCTTLQKKTPSSPSDPKLPILRGAEVKTIWIPDRIEGNRYEEGHFIHLIDKPASWSGL